MSPKEETVRLRVDTEWVELIDRAAAAESKDRGEPVTRSSFIRRAALLAARETLGTDTL